VTIIASDHDRQKLAQLRQALEVWARELGFQDLGISDGGVRDHEQRLQQWLESGYQGEMTWLAERGTMRTRPEQLVPGTQRVISVRMNYLPENTDQIGVLKNARKAYISRYSLGRDYHKLIRKRLAQMAKQLADKAVELGLVEPSQRAFVDSAPVLERPLADKAGLGWIGKHTLLINKEAGSWFFLGEILTSLPLPLNTERQANQCGDCIACLKVCPTDAFVAPYVLDARRCISYLTIEHQGDIPESLREPMGNRIFGCDDCQAICPWNKFAHHTNERDFHPRHQLDQSDLAELFSWSEAQFLSATEGSAIRRAGFERWLRNIAVALGNAPTEPDVLAALDSRKEHPSELVQRHVQWALAQHETPRRRRRKVADHKW
jgi:epoxyqueuosine reductase